MSLNKFYDFKMKTKTKSRRTNESELRSLTLKTLKNEILKL